MNRHDADRRAQVAAQLLTALYADEPSDAQRAAVLDAIAAGARVVDAPQVAARALDAAYGEPASPLQRAAVLDAIAAARPVPAVPRPARDALLALGSTVAAALVLAAVILGVRHETAQSPDAGPAGLTAEELRLRAVHAQHPEAPAPRPAVLAPTPAPVAAPAPAVHPGVLALQRGCDQGNAESCRRLGKLYQRGRGVVANRARAFELFDRSCRLGNERGCTLRDMADRSLNDVDRDDRADAEFFSTLGL